MTVTVTSNTQVTITNGGMSATQIGDNPQDIYQQIQFSDGFQFYLCGWWTGDKIQTEINNALAVHNSNNVPFFTPYAGYAAP